MNILFPYQFNTRGRTAEADEDRHIRDLIEQLLFCSPGERVNRPDFGTGLLQLVFAPNSPELAAATQLMIQGALQQWLGSGGIGSGGIETGGIEAWRCRRGAPPGRDTG